jgi:hypothetical protein
LVAFFAVFLVAFAFFAICLLEPPSSHCL